ncbi:hypothetical protein D9757_002890 [Collybiopsis confluens]|uniref:Sm domain-containing protein n=1 Tax=Collybiopsis confluens TaxID=2823264 RepID=A0A8H5HV63_9AGAR|nr:hypothetical protein D9757_002890 [Collybiopsis confluens]
MLLSKHLNAVLPTNREDAGHTTRWKKAARRPEILRPIRRPTPSPANLVLEDTVERIYHENLYAENWYGLFLIRGENVVLLGEIDLDKEDDIPLRQVEYHELEPFHKRGIELKKHVDDAKSQILYEQKGFCKEGGEGDGY